MAHSAWHQPQYPLMGMGGRVMPPVAGHQMPPFGGKGRMPNMPPPSNYAPLPKQENRDFAQLMPGQAVIKKGYNRGQPISAKGKQLMATYEKVMARPQGSFPYMSQKGGGMGGGMGGDGKKPCHFHASAQGCRNGASCKFSHEGGGGKGGKGGSAPNTSKIPCRNFPGNCSFGTKCRFMHAQ
eukprot:TRINITY_DN624_c5_g1_i1.p1 TRINITY_DN624_c5_g1~~TRINITY_DN624_c5_g1_i1.p1  ORF type:complete len:182 (+),score=36.03 TRINITY_DN624_c5_g1_i1:165-710(+)